MKMGASLKKAGLYAPTTGRRGLGPSAAVYPAYMSPGYLVAAVTGLRDGETLSSLTPNDGRLAISGATIVTGNSVTSPGSIAATVTTSEGRTLNIALTAEAAVVPIRQFARRTQTPGVQSAGSQKILSVTYHDALAPVTRVKISTTNWYVDPAQPSIEPNAGSDCTWTVAIEYPVGTITAAAPVTIPDGETGLSDWINVTIPAGARFRVWQRKAWTGAGKAIYSQAWAHDTGLTGVDRMIIGPSSDAYQFGDDITSTAAGFVSAPFAIVAEVTRDAVGIVDDSNGFGTGDAYDTSGLLGAPARLYGSRTGYVNVARGSENSDHFLAGHAKRLAGLQYCNIIHIGMGTNDLGAGFSSAKTQANLRAIADLFPGKEKWIFTDEPRTSGAWSAPDGSDQTVYGNESTRVANNTWRRSLPSPFTQCVDLADRVETARNSGKWKPGYTADGVHDARVAALEVLDAGFDLDLLGSPVTMAAPMCQREPVIAGTAQQGEVLSESDAGLWWSALEMTPAYQWQRNGDPIDGATSPSYTPTADDVGATITRATMMTNASGSSVVAVSNALGPVSGVGAPTITVTDGGGYAGSTYTATPGDGSTGGQWFADGVAIVGETALTFAMTTAYEGTSITFKQLDGAESNAIHLFVPGDLGATLISQVDAYAAATITQSGGQVSAWASQVGSHTLAQTTAGNKPIFSATARNGRPGIIFDGVDDYLSCSPLPSSFPIGSNPVTIFMAGFDNGNSLAWRAVQYGGTSGNARYIGGTLNGYTVLAANAFNVNNGASVWRNTDKIITGRIGSASISLNTDGNEIGTTSVTPTTTAALGYFLGARYSSSPTEPFKGVLQEVLVCDSILTPEQEWMVQGYLAWKWGTQAQLSAAHPYKSTPPTGELPWLLLPAISYGRSVTTPRRRPIETGRMRLLLLTSRRGQAQPNRSATTLRGARVRQCWKSMSHSKGACGLTNRKAARRYG